MVSKENIKQLFEEHIAPITEPIVAIQLDISQNPFALEAEGWQSEDLARMVIQDEEESGEDLVTLVLKKFHDQSAKGISPRIMVVVILSGEDLYALTMKDSFSAEELHQAIESQLTDLFPSKAA